MKNASELKLENQNSFINWLHNYIAIHFPDGTILFSQITVKVIVVLLIFLLLDWFQRKILLGMIQKIVPKTNNIWMNTLMEKDVFTSFFHLLPLGVCYALVPIIFYHHPQSFHILDEVFSVMLLAFLCKFLLSVINAYADIKGRDRSYRNVAFKSFSEILKILIVLFTVFIIISILFNLTSSKIFTFLGAVMAVILLIFRDPILGFVAGLNIAGSKQVKVGDQVSIPKYSIDGYVKEINLVTTKIRNSDKTVSTVPTYDLISTEVRNYEPMRNSHTRRIKRSILFNYKSFKFIDEVLLTELVNIEILQGYLTENRNAILERKLTNMTVFRYCIQLYLEQNPDISQKDTIMVRQLDPTVYGMPLEVYCFTTTSDWKKFEDIQGSIFDRIVAVSSKFDLEVIQVAAS